MTTYGAYNAGLRCKNSSCKSFGRPHPNCKCYGEYAKGGGVGAFCDEARSHEKGCEYFAEGGDTINPDEVIVDTPPPVSEKETAVPEQGEVEIPADEVVLEEIPADEVQIEPEGDPTQAPTDDYSPLGLARRIEPAFGEYPAGPDGKWTTPENLQKMADANETAFGVAALMTGGAGIKQVNKAAEGLAKMAELGKTGTSILKNAIAGGVIQGGNEVSDWLLGKGDPEAPVGAAMAHMGGAAILSGAAGGIGTATSQGLKKLAETKVGGKLMGFMAGFASAANNPNPTAEAIGPHAREVADAAVEALHKSGLQPSGSTMEAYRAGQRAFEKWLNFVPSTVARAGGAVVGHEIGGPVGALAGQQAAESIFQAVSPMVEKLVRPAAKKYVAPVTLKILSSGNTQGLLDALGHAQQVGAGYEAVTKGVQSILGAGTRASINEGGTRASDAVRKKLDDFIGNGGVTNEIQQEIYKQNGATLPAMGFAEGGEVKKPAGENTEGIQENKGVAEHYPEQNILMATARGRISNYLMGLRPQENVPKLAFDDAPDTTQQKRSYNRALDIACNPLSVLNEIRKGTLEPDHVKHFNAMHPELGGLIQKKLTEEIIKAQMDGKKPPYKVRQSLSMFMGTALSGEMTPQAIQAAQAVFAKQRAGKQASAQGAPAKGSPKALSKSDQAFLTGNQARQKRQNQL